MARVISVCNQKGGVGKTTTSVNLGAYLAALGKRVLLIDFDPQANATSALANHSFDLNIYHGILNRVHPEHLIKPTPVLNYQFIPSSNDLAGALIELVNEEEREYFLRKFVNSIRHKYDYILIDLPPSLSLLTVNGLVASDEVLIPVQAEYYGLEGLGQLLKTIDVIKNNLGHNIRIAGAVITLFDKRERLPRQVAKNLRRNFPHTVFNVEIPRSVHLAEAPSFSQPILTYEPNSSGALAYRRLAEELIETEIPRFDENRFGNLNA
ncbi:MAG: chromosome partitioning protein ParA [Candidatus Colwellbacteria bacterium CG10_big_fil_rev_8_21_14_0_10_41_28]|uniref:Chromosome partitioning protein ParA n=1 Tax=Candidatus Colwellbacteria bacterium CG10_big_fil_rev_8_21_14_0_10_41_28 TaxID=1974539 RepID=A0A2H0VGV1_9BACT|nr:MAG: chromosome partitioning protein ParA [Candidatus Colwellbacteria bacterium CG10_big_fil_rev_8_21_14_0_10_41_28]